MGGEENWVKNIRIGRECGREGVAGRGREGVGLGNWLGWGRSKHGRDRAW